MTSTTAPDPTLPVVTGTGSVYSALSRQVKAAGLLHRDLAWYARRGALTLLAQVAAWTVFALVGPSWWQLAVAGVLGLVWTQTAFLGHDAAHQQILRGRRGNVRIATVTADLLCGLSAGWWLDKHNRHHANPNKEDHDPDIGEGVLAFTTAQAERRRGVLGRFVLRHQAALFFPLLVLEGLNLHVASARWLLTHRRWTERVLFTVHTAGYLGAVLLVLPVGQAIAFMAVHQAVFGFYMGCSFAPNHKGMPVLGATERLDHLRRQVLTSRNVRGGPWVDVLLGGLNYQIEHHLFPSMPRPALRRAQPLVAAYCARHGITYVETPLGTSYRMALRHLRDLGRIDAVSPRAVFVSDLAGG